MTDKEMIDIAKKIAQDNNWFWIEPAKVIPQRKWVFFGKPQYWEVKSNAEGAGATVSVWFDAETLTVIKQNYVPR